MTEKPWSQRTPAGVTPSRRGNAHGSLPGYAQEHSSTQSRFEILGYSWAPTEGSGTAGHVAESGGGSLPNVCAGASRSSGRGWRPALSKSISYGPAGS